MNLSLKRKKSIKTFSELQSVIPSGVNSPVRSGLAVGISPLIVDHGVGDTLVDVDGHTYVDYCCSWGALIHGHAHPYVVNNVQHQVTRGMSFGACSPLEERLARKVIDAVPSIEKVRFVSSGTEATMTAARLARGFTNRDVIVKFDGNYHGHADLFLTKAGSSAMSTSAGIPKDAVKHTVSLRYNDVAECRQFLLDPKNRNYIAAVIVEPIAGNMGVIPASQKFLTMLREVTHAIGALLIFDEVITGFRVDRGGAQALYKIQPDITCLGKIIGGGMPAAAVGGPAEIMDVLAPQGNVFQAGTLSGNPLAMEAGYQTLLLLESPSIYGDLQRKADIITQPVQEHFESLGLEACLQQVGSMFSIFFGVTKVSSKEDLTSLDTDTFARFFQALFHSGIFIPPSPYESWFISTVHTEEHLEKTRDAIIDFVEH